ncbi:hypothetical protein [Salinarimonas sp.]|uniref:hypothetical protein n=1 Tax=Salinarimonas sp. TaxID=2766526 RepID=UPI0032D8E0E7
MAETRATLAGPIGEADAAARAALAWTPLVLAAGATLVAGLAGLHARGLIGTPLEPWAFGYFVERFPLFAGLLVYAAARVVLLALIPPGPSRFLRLALLSIALAILVLPALYPTFGGVVIRAAYFTGGMAWLQSAPLAAAYPIGAFVSASVFAASLGLAAALARLAPAFGWRRLADAALRLLALWFAALVVAAQAALGLSLLGEWPIWPLRPGEAVAAALLVALAALPHAILVARTGR